MDCEYILLIKIGTRSRDEISRKFHAATPEDAVGTAREIVRHHQAESVREFPFAPVVVKGELYRQFQEFDGSEFIKTTDGRPYVTPQA